MIFETRAKSDTVVKIDEIPETIEIGVLANEYQASKFRTARSCRRSWTA